MKVKIIKTNLVIFGAMLLSCSGFAAQALRYDVSITNGAGMPISPALVYVKSGDTALSKIGEAPSAGFVKLCQTGNAMDRIAELKKMSSVTSVTQATGMGPILPGETRTVTVSLKDPSMQSIQLESMYGKSKDICGVVSIGSHSLYGLKAHVAAEVNKTDEVIATGAFLDAALPEYPLTTQSCENAKDAPSCLRELSLENMSEKRVRFFSAYLPSVLSHIEHLYGAEETQALLIPTSGAIRVNVKLKH